MATEDGRFQITAVPGAAFFRMSTPPGWSLKAVMLDDVDMTDAPYELPRLIMWTGPRQE